MSRRYRRQRRSRPLQCSQPLYSKCGYQGRYSNSLLYLRISRLSGSMNNPVINASIRVSVCNLLTRISWVKVPSLTSNLRGERCHILILHPLLSLKLVRHLLDNHARVLLLDKIRFGYIELIHIIRVLTMQTPTQLERCLRHSRELYVDLTMKFEQHDRYLRSIAEKDVAVRWSRTVLLRCVPFPDGKVRSANNKMYKSTNCSQLKLKR